MRYLLDHGDTPLPPPETPDQLRPIEIAAESGLLPRPPDPIVREWFLAGTDPVENAAVMYATIEGRERLVLPPEYAAWYASSENRLAAVARSPDFEILSPRDGDKKGLPSD